MLGHSDMIAIVVVVLALVFAGVHIAISLGITAALGIYLMTGDVDVVRDFVANTAYEALRDYVFAVIPLFMLMGDLLAKCGAARDIYALANRLSGWLPARLAVATILSNALFGFVTGVSIAADVSATPTVTLPEDEQPISALLFSTMLVILLVAGTLGAIWLGVCTPTEGASVGAIGSLILALVKGIKPRETWQVVLDVGRTCGPLLLLLFCAQLYSRVLAMTGFTEAAKVFLLSTGAGPWGILTVMVAIWFVLGCLIDSISIILLTVPIFAPIATHLGFDPLAFAIMGILAIETGLLTPPFGILVFTVKAAVPDRSVTLAEIFRGSIPYWIVLLVVVVALAAFPKLATFLPGL